MAKRRASTDRPAGQSVEGSTFEPTASAVFTIDLDWSFRPGSEAIPIGTSKVAGELAGRDVRVVWREIPEAIDAIGRALGGERTVNLVTIGDASHEIHCIPLRDHDGDVLGVDGSCLDVTARQRALRRARDAAARFRAFVRSSSELVTLQDASGLCVWANDLHERMLGIPLEEIVGKPSFAMSHLDDRARVERELRSPSGEDRAKRITFRVCASDDRIVWISMTARSFTDDDGKEVLLTVAHDVTREVQLQQRLEQQAENERRVSELSRHLMSLPSEHMSEAVSDSMSEVARVAGADHTTLVIATGDGGDRFERHDWPEQTPATKRPDVIGSAIRQLPAMKKLFADGSPLQVPSPDALPPQAKLERADMIRRGVKSTLTIPLRFRDRVVGFQIFESHLVARRWSEQDIALLTLLGEVLARAVERDHTHATLFASEEKFRALSENMTDIVLEIDQTGQLVWASPSFRDILGREPEEVFGVGMVDLIHPDDLQATRRSLGKALRELTVGHSTYRTRHADGHWLWLETRGRGYQTSSGAIHYVGHARDITEQRRFIDALERRHRADREIASLSSRFLRQNTDELDAGLSDGIQSVVEIAEADRAYLLDITERPLRLVSSRDWSKAEIDRVLRGGGAEYLERYGWAFRRLARGEVLVISDTATLPDDASGVGEEMDARGIRSLLGIPIISDGRLVGYLGVEYLEERREWSEREISEMQMLAGVFAGALQRARAERALEEQLEFERRVFELSQKFLGVSSEGLEDAIRDALAATGELADLDRAVLLSFPVDRSGVPEAASIETFEWCAPGISLAGVDPAQWKTRWALNEMTIRIPRVDRIPEEHRAMRERLEGRGVQSFLGLSIPTQSGHSGFLGLETRRRRQNWSDQQISMFRLLGELFGSALRRLAAERALQESQHQLMHSQKMEAVGRLAGGIAHDFNNLLTVILGFSRSMLSDLDEGTELREDAVAISAAAERAAALTRQLLTFSRRQMSVSGTIDLAKIARGLRGMLERLLGASYELVLASPSESCWALVDSAQIEQALVNLVVNARDAMPEGGRIVVRLRTQQLDGVEAGRFGLKTSGRYHLIEIEDQGVGIPPELLDRIFEPFYTTKGPGKGTGLGLSIVYSVLREHGGGVAVESSPDNGARFSVAIPACDSVVLEGARESLHETQEGEETILLVEDEPMVRRLLARIFGRAGYRVIEAVDGEQALALIEVEGMPTIDVLVTDIVMPGINGGELARRVRTLDPEVPVLYVSGHPQDRGPLEEAPILPAGRYLTKPFEEARLLSEVRLALEGQQ